MALDLVLFDMDGVIFSGENFWYELHRIYNTDERALEYAEKYLTTNYKLLAEATAWSLWRGRGAGPLHQLVEQREYEEGVTETFEKLHQWGIKTAIISSGPHQLAQRAQQELGVDYIRANRLTERSGILTGYVDVQVDDSQKETVAREIIERTGANPENTAAVGDSAPDLGLAREVGYFIAYNPKDSAVVEKADYVCQTRDLREILPVLGRMRVEAARSPLSRWDESLP